jgi:predicted MFS family arabinose efflux permease
VTALGLLFTLSFVVMVDLRILAPVLPSVSASLGATPGTVGLAMASYTLAYGAGQLVYGPLSDRYGRVRVVRAAALAFGVLTALSATSLTAWQFVVTRFLAGAAAGAVIPLTLVHIGDTVEYAQRQPAIARLATVTSGAFAFSASVGGVVAHFVSWRAMLLGYGVLTLIPALAMFRLDTGAPPRRAGSDRPLRFVDFLADPRARAVYVAVFLEGLLLWGGVTYLGAMAARRHGLDQLGVGLLIAVFGVGTMAGGGLVPWSRRRLGERDLAAGGGVLMGLAYLLLVPRWPWPVWALAMLPLGLGFSALHTTLQLRGSEISAAARGKAFSLFAFSLFSGIALGTAGLGRLVDRGSDTLFLGVCGLGLTLVGLGTARFGREPRR